MKHGVGNICGVVQVELTLQLVARRDFPLAEARNKFLDEQQIMLRRVMYQEWDLEDDLEPRHQLMLSRIKKAASGQLLNTLFESLRRWD